ncbi:MAG: hypothetical protein RIR41_1186 [Pseudomonadota bacterium]|jgi:hypothetical protein
MADNYVKIWASITDSSVWSRPSNIRIVWLTMLAMSDQHGFVGASVDGLARRANVPIEDVETALAEFMAPDKRSRNPENEGRRIQEVPRGWHILNHGYFRDLRDKEERREYERRRKQEQRDRAKASGTCPVMSGTSPKSPSMSAHASESASASASETQNTPPPPKGGDLQVRSRKALASRPDDVTQKIWDDFMAQRRARLTPTALAGLQREADKAGWPLERVMAECCLRGWQGFKAAWVDGRRPGAPPPTSTVTSGKRIYQEHPAAMPVPYETPMARCECGLCGKRRAQAVAS